MANLLGRVLGGVVEKNIFNAKRGLGEELRDMGKEQIRDFGDSAKRTAHGAYEGATKPMGIAGDALDVVTGVKSRGERERPSRGGQQQEAGFLDGFRAFMNKVLGVPVPETPIDSFRRTEIQQRNASAAQAQPVVSRQATYTEEGPNGEAVTVDARSAVRQTSYTELGANGETLTVDARSAVPQRSYTELGSDGQAIVVDRAELSAAALKTPTIKTDVNLTAAFTPAASPAPAAIAPKSPTAGIDELIAETKDAGRLKTLTEARAQIAPSGGPS